MAILVTVVTVGSGGEALAKEVPGAQGCYFSGIA